jgi:hypothetical protein
MKKLIIGLVFGLIVLSIHGQDIIKFRTTDFCYQLKSVDSGSWLDWSEWITVNILVVINVKDLQIKIYSETVQVYDITELYDERFNDKGESITEFRAVDQDGDFCGIRLMTRNSGQLQLYIDYSDIRWVYNIYSVN